MLLDPHNSANDAERLALLEQLKPLLASRSPVIVISVLSQILALMISRNRLGPDAARDVVFATIDTSIERLRGGGGA